MRGAESIHGHIEGSILGALQHADGVCYHKTPLRDLYDDFDIMLFRWAELQLAWKDVD